MKELIFGISLFLFACSPLLGADQRILSEKEQEEFDNLGCNYISSNTFSDSISAIAYLNVAIKGDHHSIKCYRNNTLLPTEEDRRRAYGEDISTGLYSLWPRSSKDEVFNLLITILKTKWEYPEALSSAAIHIRFVHDSQVIPLLRPILKHPDLRVRCETAGSLYELDDGDEALPVLKELIEEHAYRCAMVHLFEWKKGNIIRLRDDRGYQILLKAIGSNNLYSKVESTYFLSEAKLIPANRTEKIAIEALSSYKSMSDYGLKYDTHKELIPMQPLDDSALEKAKNQWKADNQAYQTALALLERLRSKKAIPVLEKFTKNAEDSYIKRRANEALVFIRGK